MASSLSQLPFSHFSLMFLRIFSQSALGLTFYIRPFLSSTHFTLQSRLDKNRIALADMLELKVKENLPKKPVEILTRLLYTCTLLPRQRTPSERMGVELSYLDDVNSMEESMKTPDGAMSSQCRAELLRFLLPRVTLSSSGKRVERRSEEVRLPDCQEGVWHATLSCGISPSAHSRRCSKSDKR